MLFIPKKKKNEAICDTHVVSLEFDGNMISEIEKFIYLRYVNICFGMKSTCDLIVPLWMMVTSTSR